MGLAYTYFDCDSGCTLMQDYQDYEGRPAADLLSLIKSDFHLKRSMALALINALAQPGLEHFPPDKDNEILFNALGIGPSTNVAMVGFIKPLVEVLQSKGASVEVIDESRGMGDKPSFYQKLGHWADAALITSTSLLNQTFEEIMQNLGSGVRAALLGPSTPMVVEAFLDWPAIRALAGTVNRERDPLLKAVRHGLGTPYLHKHSKKVTLTLQGRRTSDPALPRIRLRR
jgi:hypothetical protein